MSLNEIKDYISSLCSHLTFDFHGKSCGIDPISSDHFDMWYGDDFMEAHGIEEVMQTPFFDGKALEDIVDQLENVEGM